MRPVHVALVEFTSHNACLCAKHQNLIVLILLLAILKKTFPHLWDCYCQIQLHLLYRKKYSREER